MGMNNEKFVYSGFTDDCCLPGDGGGSVKPHQDIAFRAKGEISIKFIVVC